MTAARTATTQTTTTGWILRIGSTAGIAGALLGMVGNLIHPATPIGDPEGVAATIADSRIWVPGHLAIVVGLVLILGGLLAVAQSIQGGLPGALARLGAAAAVAGITVGLILVTLDGIAAKQLAEAWATAPPDERAGALARLGAAAAVAGITVGLILVTLDGIAAKQLAEAWATAPPDERATALRLVLASETLNFALAALFNILFAGVTFILYGLAVAWSRQYPRWLGWVVVVAGIGSVAAGLLQAVVGEPTVLSRILTIIFPTVITLWLVDMNVLVLRRAASLERAEAGQG
jgi:hypothetical protein